MRIFQNGKEITAVDFGEVEMGVKKEIAVDIVNDSDATLSELNYNVNPDIDIVFAPKSISPRDTGTLRLSWTPKLELKEPIKVNLEITGKEIFKG